MCSFMVGLSSIARRYFQRANKSLAREKSQSQQRLGLLGAWRSSMCSPIIMRPDLNRASTVGDNVISPSIQSATCSPARPHHQQFQICVSKMFGLATSIGFGANRKVLTGFAERNGCRSHAGVVRNEK